MSDRLQIYCKNIDRYIEIKGGETLSEIATRIGDELGFEPICALVNNKNEFMGYPVFQPKMVEFLTPAHPSGHRAYVRSLCMVLYRAVTKLFPMATMRIEHSISNGYYCRLYGVDRFSAAELSELRAEMRAIIDADMPFKRKERITKDVIEIFKKQRLFDKVTLLGSLRELYTVYYKLDDICDSYYGVLAPRTGMLKHFELKLFKDGFLLYTLSPKSVPGNYFTSTYVAQEKMYRAYTDYLEFNRIIGLSNVGELNEAIKHKRTAELINVAEALHEKQISRISDEITRRYHQGGARIILVAGPSSSGKTTTAKRLAIQLHTNLLVPQTISLDDYFVERDKTPRDESGDYDFESLYALDLKLFNHDLNLILRGEEVELPTYRFDTGKRVYKGNRIKLRPNGVLLIEGIHGLNPELTSGIDDNMKFKVFVSALTTISIDDHNWIPASDNRLLRRIIRDYQYRGISAEESIRRWPSVRRGEEKWIIPYQENADATFNSSLLFELGVMKDQANEILQRVPQDVVEYAEAYRLRKFLRYFLPVGKDMIPSTSLLREFMGGSSFKY